MKMMIAHLLNASYMVETLIYELTPVCLYVTHCFDYRNFVIWSEIRKCEISSLVLFQDYFGYLGCLDSIHFMIEFFPVVQKMPLTF